MSHSDTLDMVGVQLKATWSQTRKVNGEMIQKKVSQIINSWKSGKFMNVTSRPWSLNTYALTMVWISVILLICVSVTSTASLVKLGIGCSKTNWRNQLRWCYTDPYSWVV